MLRIKKVIPKIQEYVANVSAYPECVDYVKIEQLMKFLKEIEELELNNYRTIALTFMAQPMSNYLFSANQRGNPDCYDLISCDDFDKIDKLDVIGAFMRGENNAAD